MGQGLFVLLLVRHCKVCPPVRRAERPKYHLRLRRVTWIDRPEAEMGNWARKCGPALGKNVFGRHATREDPYSFLGFQTFAAPRAGKRALCVHSPCGGLGGLRNVLHPHRSGNLVVLLKSSAAPHLPSIPVR